MNEFLEILQVITPIIVSVATVAGKLVLDKFRIETSEAIQAESKKTRDYIDKLKKDLTESITNIKGELAKNGGRDEYRDNELKRINDELLLIKKKVFR